MTSKAGKQHPERRVSGLGTKEECDMTKKWTSPWEEFRDAIKAETRVRNKRRNELGLAFRAVQQEAIDKWLALEAEEEAQKQEEHK